MHSYVSYTLMLLQIIQLYQIILSLGIRQSSSTTSVTSAPSMARGAIHGCYWFQHLMSWESLLGLTRALGDTNVTLARDSLVKSWFSFRSRVSRASTCDHVTSSSDTTSNGSSSVTDITEEVIASVLAMQEVSIDVLYIPTDSPSLVYLNLYIYIYMYAIMYRRRWDCSLESFRTPRATKSMP
jgi:hypothetical protein